MANTSKAYAVSINSNEISSKITGFKCASYQDKKVEWSYDFTKSSAYNELPAKYYTNNGRAGDSYNINNVTNAPKLPDIYYAEKDPANWLSYYQKNFCKVHYAYCGPGKTTTNQAIKNQLKVLVSEYKKENTISTSYNTVDNLNISFNQNNILSTIDCYVNNEILDIYDILIRKINIRNNHNKYKYKLSVDIADESIAIQTQDSTKTNTYISKPLENKTIQLQFFTDLNNKLSAYFNVELSTKLSSVNYVETLELPSRGSIITTNNINDTVLHNMKYVIQECVCYSDCGGYSVCWCYGNCNHY